MPYIEPGQTHSWCKLGEHEEAVDRFKGRWRETPLGTRWHIDPSCKFHVLTKKHADKHADLAGYILKSRASDLARKTGTTLDFVLYDRRGPCWIRLQPLLEAFLVEHADCTSCGEAFEPETRDVQFDHIHAPRKLPNGEIDWARHCARNIRILCGSCNNSKGRKADEIWIDDEYHRQLLAADLMDAQRRALEVEQEVPPPKPCGCPPEGMCLLCYQDDTELAA